MRHVGKNRKTDARYVIASMSIVDDEDHCLVIQSDVLPVRYQDELDATLKSNNAQAATKFLDVLTKARFSDNEIMANFLHRTGRFLRIPTADVIMTPDKSNSIILKELNERLKNIEPEKPNVVSTNVSAHKDNYEIEKTQETKHIAAKLLYEADLIWKQAVADVNERRERAYQYDPSLRPKTKVPDLEPDVISLVEGNEKELKQVKRRTTKINKTAARKTKE